MKLSRLSETLIGSEIVKLGGEIRDRIRQGEKIYNFTVGDFDPAIFPIPQALEDEIVTAYREQVTNYPPAEGTLELREALGGFIKQYQGLDYAPDEILIASGGRPLIYAFFRAVVDEGDKVVYAVPSWNNNHYVHFVQGVHVVVQTSPEHHFMPTAKDLAPHLKEAVFLALCSPQNPTGTTLDKEELTAICDMVVAENKLRGPDQKKLYLLYDQMYSHLTYGGVQHYDPVSLNPDMKSCTIYIDAISKCFAATGVRVGWSMGPAQVLEKMKAILSHVGAWAPSPEQRGLTRFLGQQDAIDNYLGQFKKAIETRLLDIYEGFMELKERGFPVDAIAPQAAIYLTIKLDLAGKSFQGNVLRDQAAVTSFLLAEASLAIVPFYAFGADKASPWYRLSVGTCRLEAIPEMLAKLRTALEALRD